LTLLAGKRLVITGALTKDSIAWSVASEAQKAGAEVILTSFGRARRLTERAARQLPEECDVLELDGRLARPRSHLGNLLVELADPVLVHSVPSLVGVAEMSCRRVLCKVRSNARRSDG